MYTDKLNDRQKWVSGGFFDHPVMYVHVGRIKVDLFMFSLKVLVSFATHLLYSSLNLIYMIRNQRSLAKNTNFK